jgi:hypothetical protein
VSQRLRLALFLAALAATSPLPSARLVETPRAEISVAWFRSDAIVRLRGEHSRQALAGPIVARVGFQAHPDTALPNTLLSTSLFQRPPPRLR